MCLPRKEKNQIKSNQIATECTLACDKHTYEGRKEGREVKSFDSSPPFPFPNERTNERTMQQLYSILFNSILFIILTYVHSPVLTSRSKKIILTAIYIYIYKFSSGAGIEISTPPTPQKKEIAGCKGGERGILTPRILISRGNKIKAQSPGPSIHP